MLHAHVSPACRLTIVNWLIPKDGCYITLPLSLQFVIIKSEDIILLLIMEDAECANA